MNEAHILYELDTFEYWKSLDKVKGDYVCSWKYKTSSDDFVEFTRLRLDVIPFSDLDCVRTGVFHDIAGSYPGIYGDSDKYISIVFEPSE